MIENIKEKIANFHPWMEDKLTWVVDNREIVIKKQLPRIIFLVFFFSFSLILTSILSFNRKEQQLSNEIEEILGEDIQLSISDSPIEINNQIYDVNVYHMESAKVEAYIQNGQLVAIYNTNSYDYEYGELDVNPDIRRAFYHHNLGTPLELSEDNYTHDHGDHVHEYDLWHVDTEEGEHYHVYAGKPLFIESGDDEWEYLRIPPMSQRVESFFDAQMDELGASREDISPAGLDWNYQEESFYFEFDDSLYRFDMRHNESANLVVYE